VLHLRVLIQPGVRRQAGLDAGLGEELQGIKATPGPPGAGAARSTGLGLLLKIQSIP
jgi:hypothetical protein